jgi:5-formyltetrahydrofolate cyclo-ligase
MSQHTLGKDEIRQRLLSARYKLSQSEVNNSSTMITKHCINHIDWKSVNSVHIYIPIKKYREPDTHPILNYIWENHASITTAVPVMVSGQIHSSSITPNSKFNRGSAGILEPSDSEYIAQDHQFDLIIVPTLGFDRDRYRIGYGKGHYDRFLANQTGRKVGFAYERGFIKSGIPLQAHDIQLNSVITEQKIH